MPGNLQNPNFSFFVTPFFGSAFRCPPSKFYFSLFLFLKKKIPGFEVFTDPVPVQALQLGYTVDRC
jgi:hypothetical protein